MFFTVEKIEKQLKEIQTAIVRDHRLIPQFRYWEGDHPPSGVQPVPGAEQPDFDDRSWEDFSVGSTWGDYDRLAWFRAWVPVPEGWEQKKLALHLLVGPRDGGESTAECMLYGNGQPLQGIDIWHTQAWIPPELIQDGKFFIAIKAWSGVLGVPDRRRFRMARLVVIDEAAERFYYRSDTVLRSINALDANDLRRSQMLQALNGAFHQVEFLEPGSDDFYNSLEEADACLEQAIHRMDAFLELKPRVTAIGHAHLDVAWLWRLRHTREKAARTFATALHLMRQYPEYVFMHSTPQVYQYLKEDYPDLYARVKEKIASGQWEITGAMWVEADTNIPSGESLVRQILHGKRFARDEFGVDMRVLWLPDVFGYSWALPQIMRKSGIQAFLTSKISWSQFNRFPYDSFRWRGIDGTEIPTHFITTPEESSHFYTYNGRLTAGEVKGMWDEYRQKDINDELLELYGWGDGGGGPTQEMLESARYLRNMPGLPEVRLGSAEEHLERLSRKLSTGDAPVWDGELYLEYHRGTYTSQAQNKRFNRKSEILLHDAEFLSAAADILQGSENYPHNDLHKAWELVLLNQFHDILPGSSIRDVYQDSRQDYLRVQELGKEAVRKASEAVLENLAASEKDFMTFNTLSWDRGGVVSLPWDEHLANRSSVLVNGQQALLQPVESGGGREILLEVPPVPALGYRVDRISMRGEHLPVEEVLAEETTGSHLGGASKSGGKTFATLLDAHGNGDRLDDELSASENHLENALYRIEFNDAGQMVSIWDKRFERHVVPPGSRANVFQAFEDKPMHFDAWDVDIYYQEKMREVEDLREVVVEETGPVRATLRLRWKFARSTITQWISLYRSSPRIDFRTHVDWQQSQVLLKVAFPVLVRTTRATYDIQFGNIERPTHWNTSWDYARFETVGHKWADLSEGNYGVALLNDCKYGYDARDNVLRLTLIKSAISPDKRADRGEHTFTYSLLPHGGDWRQGEVDRHAHELNYPLLVARGVGGGKGSLPSSWQFATVDAPNVIVDTVKQAEDGDGWTVRLYENMGFRSDRVHLKFSKELADAVECNLLEEEPRKVAFQDATLVFPVTPYEIKTFRVHFE